MKFRVKLVAVFDAVAGRDAAVAAIQTKLDERPRFDGTVTPTADAQGRPGLVCLARWDAQADADTAETWLKTRAQAAGVVTARLSWHRCSHDLPPDQLSPCNTAAVGYREWTR